jgi:hypothetical protein
MFKQSVRLCFAALVSVIALSSGVRASGPAAIIYPDGDSQHVYITESVGAVVQVHVRDAADQAVPFPKVQWQGPATGPRVTFEPYDAGGEEDGAASVIVHAVGGMGTFEITASISGATPATIIVTTYADPLRIVSGSHQSAPINSEYTEPLIAQARTLDGEPIAGATVNFAVAGSAGVATLSAASVVTGSDGLAAITVTAGAQAAAFNVEITAPPIDYDFGQIASFGIIARPVQSIRVWSGADQELPIGGGTRVLKAQVSGPNGEGIENAAVTFSGPAAGAGIGRFDCYSDCPLLIANGARVFTNYLGEATVVVAANDDAGSYVVTATAEGATSVASFVLTNVPRRAATIRPNGDDAQLLHGEQAKAGGRFERIRLRVIDVDGAGLGGAVITLTPPSTGASLTLDQPVLVSDSDGWVETSGTANNIVGSYYLQAETPGTDPTFMFMQNAPDGFVIGDQIADLAAADQAGTTHTPRSFTAGGRYLLLDVCTAWCTVCRATQQFGQEMRADLIASGIPIAVVPMLIDSTIVGEPSTQRNASDWATRYQIADPVLHADGNAFASIREFSQYLLGGQQGYPTFLLISPEGIILDRHTGGFASPDQMTRFVLAHVPSDAAIASASVVEGATATLTVTRSPATSAAAVDYSTTSGSASAADFSRSAGTIQFEEGQASATITVPTVNDTLDEPNEQFTVTLSNPVNLRINQGTAAVTIVDNDAAPAMSVDEARFSEGTGKNITVQVPVRLDRASAFTISADYGLIAGTAKASDLLITKGTVKFAPGQTVATIPIELAADSIVEAKETFTIRLANAVNATLAKTDTAITIVDDDNDTVAPAIDSHANVIVEVKMSPTSTVLVDYQLPKAVDKNDGTLIPVCTAPPGAKHGYGTETVVCIAEDKAGNQAITKFGLTVRTPTVAGAIFDPLDTSVPLTERDRGAAILVRVNAGAFAPGAAVALAFVDAKEKRHSLGTVAAAADGSLNHVVNLPNGTSVGAGQVVADSSSSAGDYDRAWFLTVTKKGNH